MRRTTTRTRRPLTRRTRRHILAMILRAVRTEGRLS